MADGCNKFHSKLQTDDGIHTMIAYEFADATERLAFVPSPEDLGKIVRQINTNAYFIIADTAPLNYVELTGVLPLSAKGDLVTYNGGAIAALSVGADGQVLTADSGEVTGLKWETNAVTDENVKISANDTTTGYLEDKVVTSSGLNATNPLELSTLNDGLDEDLQIQFDESKVNHDNLAGFVANEHIDWTQPGAGTIDPSNYADNNTDELAKVSANDTTADYLFNKFQGGTGITVTEINDGANEKIEISAPGAVSDELVKVSANDTTAGYLFQKIIAASEANPTNALEIKEVNDGADEDLKIALDESKLSVTSSQVTDFTEASQDAVGAALADTASIDFTYNDVGNQITADVLPAGVDHDALNNFVANEHIDHSAVTITGSDGLAGGGDITASRTITMPDVVTAGSSSSASQTLNVTVDAKGRITAFSRTAISILASAVSDFASAVRSTVLTGLSTATSTAVVATDSILVAIGKLQGQLNKAPKAEAAQYSNSTSQSVASGLNTDLLFQTSRDSVLGTLFAKPTDQEIRTDFNGRIGIYFKINFHCSNNSRMATFTIKKNGSSINYSSSRNRGNDTINEMGGASFYAEFNCSSGDLWRINLAATSTTVTVPVNEAFFGIKAIRID